MARLNLIFFLTFLSFGLSLASILSANFNQSQTIEHFSTYRPPPQPSINAIFDVDDVETFYEIPSMLRVKRQVKFPQDDNIENESVTEIRLDDDINSADNDESALEGRALKQTMQSVTKVDVGVQSQLFVSPGSTSVIYFEVTNLRNEPTYHTFSVQDEKRFLRSMEPRFLWLQPNQKESVRVTILVPQGSELGIKDKITFTAIGAVQTTQSVVVTVSNGITDSWAPRVWYTYNTRCDWRLSCDGGTWSIEVVARDYETGMLSIRSNPEGILLRAPFEAGTTEEVKATYSASCCEPRVTVTSYDLNRNQRTLQLNVNDPWLSEYGIATVVLACLFLICFIILIVLWVIWCCKRRKSNNLEGPIH